MFVCFYSLLFLSPFIPFGLTIQESVPSRHIKQAPVSMTVSFVSPLWMWGCFLACQQQINMGNGKVKRRQELVLCFFYILHFMFSWDHTIFFLLFYSFLPPSLPFIFSLLTWTVLFPCNNDCRWVSIKAMQHMNKIKVSETLLRSLKNF